MSDALPRRPLGRTGLEVSALGFGGWGIGGAVWGEVNDANSMRALRAAIERGVNFIDTAIAYGPHRSERLVGEVVRAASEEVLVATKVPPKNLRWPAAAGVALDELFPADHVRRCAERSLQNLGTETVDLLQLHAWRDEWLGEGDWEEAVAELKAEGKIRHFGISTNDHEPGNAVAAAAAPLIETIQVIYNLFEQAPADVLLPACAEHGVGVIARVPFDEGALTGRIDTATEFADDDWRRHYFRDERLAEVDQRVKAITADLEIDRADLPGLALRFDLSHPAVATVIAGMRSDRHVGANVIAAAHGPLGPAALAKLRAHRWQKNFYT
jgi:aryl-alcohol dehydrogenase-like predicted oxidoreductase